MILTELLAAWFLADFISGLVHWFEDRYLTEATEIGRDNILHHTDPRAMTRISMWENVKGSLTYGIPLSITLFLIEAPLVIYMSVLFACSANLVHRWAHENKNKLPKLIRLLKDTCIMISARHHSTHHYEAGKVITKAQAKEAYCAMTNYVNPILDEIAFWYWLERLLHLFGMRTIEDTGYRQS
jgi:ubiquitin-conjugating enzyme E2 variant